MYQVREKQSWTSGASLGPSAGPCCCYLLSLHSLPGPVIQLLNISNYTNINIREDHTVVMMDHTNKKITPQSSLKTHQL